MGKEKVNKGSGSKRRADEPSPGTSNSKRERISGNVLNEPLPREGKQIRKINKLIPNSKGKKNYRKGKLIEARNTGTVNNNAVPTVSEQSNERIRTRSQTQVDLDLDHSKGIKFLGEIPYEFDDLTQHDRMDSNMYNSEFSDAEIEHDGVEVAVQSSDDEFRDEEGLNSSQNDASSSDESEDEEVTLNTNKDKLQELKNDPQFAKYIEQLVEQKVQETTGVNKKGKKANDKGNGNDANDKLVTPLRKTNVSCKLPGVKSPSDSTLYTPALKRVSETRQANDMLNRITTFVEGIRLESTGGTSKDHTPTREVRDTDVAAGDRREVVHREISDAEQDDIEPRIDHEVSDELQQARERTDQVILQAEKFKASVAAPKGKIPLYPFNIDAKQLKNEFVTQKGLGPIDEKVQWLRNWDQDDEFFHVTCHVEESLRSKIEKGEFVDLERLLPKEKGPGRMSEDSLFKFGVKDGHPYVSAANESAVQINSVKRWDQAFRIYSAIYTEANPSRSGEIWQYIYVIHSAASSFPWENVAFYDYTFRRLMAEKPWRSWGKTYNQGWNLALKGNPNGGHSGNSFVPRHHNNNANSAGDYGNSSKQHDWRDNCCRRFNKNRCTRPSNECRWDHRCTYCGIWNHGKFNCRKRQAKEGGNTYQRNSGNPQSSSPATTTTAVVDKK